MIAPAPDENPVHGTALVVGTHGILLTGPSGAGKSAMALRLIGAAAAGGIFVRLISDDRVFLHSTGGRVVASPPPAIAGLIECRGSGILELPYLPRAVLHAALAPAAMSGEDRVPPDDERYPAPDGLDLPLLRMDYAEPQPLEVLHRLITRI